MFVEFRSFEEACTVLQHDIYEFSVAHTSKMSTSQLVHFTQCTFFSPTKANRQQQPPRNHTLLAVSKFNAANKENLKSRNGELYFGMHFYLNRILKCALPLYCVEIYFIIIIIIITIVIRAIVHWYTHTEP